MEFDDTIYNQIDLYISGQMEASDREEFEQRIESDIELRKEVFLQKSIKLAVQDNDEDWILNDQYIKNNDAINQIKALRKQKDYVASEANIKKVANQYFDHVKHKKSVTWKLYIGAVAAVLCIALMVYYFNPFNPSMNDLYSEYSNWNELPSLTTQSESQNNLSLGEELFLKKKYNEAISIFSKEIHQGSIEDSFSKPYVLVYLGISYLEIEEYDKALKTFDTLIQSDGLDRSKGYWYKALVFLKKGDKEKTKNQLKLLLQDEKNFNFQKAKDLMHSLH